jgi:hypothetical protein
MIFGMQAFHKARHLLCRLCWGCLPTRVQLYQWCVDCDVHCPICENTTEDDLHIFFDNTETHEC